MTEQSASSPPSKPLLRWLVWLFAALGIATAVAIIGLAIMVFGDNHRREPAEVAAAHVDEALQVGAVEPLEQTNLIAIQIQGSDRSGAVGSVKSSYSDLRNIVLLDRTTGTTRRILPDNKTHIAGVTYLPARAQPGSNRPGPLEVSIETGPDGAKSPPSYYVLELERVKDGHSTIDLLVGILASGEQGVVMQGLDGVEQLWMVDERRLGLIVRDGKALFFRVVDIPTRKVLESRKIEIG